MDDEDSAQGGSLNSREQETLADEFKGLVSDAQAFAQAEFAYQKSRASYAGKQALIAAGLVGAGLVFLFFAVEALVFGALLALAESLTPLGATAAVTAILVAAALLCMLLALIRWKRMKAKIGEQDDKR